MANLVAPTVAWESKSQLSAAMLPLEVALVQLPDGGWALDDEASADGFLARTADDGWAVDDATDGGLLARTVAGVAIGIDAGA